VRESNLSQITGLVNEDVPGRVLFLTRSGQQVSGESSRSVQQII
jgi:hypothetical protein